jgi:hypothetical protein
MKGFCGAEQRFLLLFLEKEEYSKHKAVDKHYVTSQSCFFFGSFLKKNDIANR